MKLRVIGLAMGAVLGLGAALSLPSCGHDQKLVSVTVNPAGGFTFLSDTPALTFQFTATGTYIHPPATKDITKEVKWAADFPELVTFSATTPGLVSPQGTACGGADISATAPEGTGGPSNVVIGYSTVTVEDPTNPICPGGGKFAVLSVAINPAGFGSVTSVDGSINCPGTCFAQFSVGAQVGLTATPGGGHSFLSWNGCTSSTGNSCTVTVPTGGTSVTANFQ